MDLLGTEQASLFSLSFLETSSVEGTKVRVGPEHWAPAVWGITPLRCDFYAIQLSHLKCSVQVLKVDSHGDITNITINSRKLHCPGKTQDQ